MPGAIRGVTQRVSVGLADTGLGVDVCPSPVVAEAQTGYAKA